MCTHAACAGLQVYEVMWGPAPQQLMVATQRGSVDVLSTPNMEVLWSLQAHTSACYCFATDRRHKWVGRASGQGLLTGVMIYLVWAQAESQMMGHDSHTCNCTSQSTPRP